MMNSKKEQTDVTLKVQLKNVFLANLKAVGVVFIVFFIFFFSLRTIKVVKNIMDILAILIYAIMIASAANKCATQDKRSCAVTKMYPLKGVLLSISIPVANMVMFGLLQLVWLSSEKMVNMIGQLIFTFWTFPYNGFLQLQGPHVGVLGIALMIAVPLICAGAGYFAGYCNWDIYEKLDKIVFEKRND